METAEYLLKKLAELADSIKYTEKAIFRIESALRNKANHHAYINGYGNKPILAISIEMIEPILEQRLTKLRSNHIILIGIQHEVMGNKKFEVMDDFEANDFNKDCLACWINNEMD